MTKIRQTLSSALLICMLCSCGNSSNSTAPSGQTPKPTQASNQHQNKSSTASQPTATPETQASESISTAYSWLNDDDAEIEPVS